MGLRVPELQQDDEGREVRKETQVGVDPYMLANFLHQLISALDTGKYEDISVTEVETRLRTGDLIPYLIATFGTDVDLSFFDAEDSTLPVDVRERARARSAAMHQELLRLVDSFAGREHWGVQRSGLCLLLTYGVFLLKLQAAQVRVRNQQIDDSMLP
jgi:hypothetical protein